MLFFSFQETRTYGPKKNGLVGGGGVTKVSDNSSFFLSPFKIWATILAERLLFRGAIFWVLADH